IAEIYNLLYPCTQVSELVKQQHIDDINNSLNNHVIKENGIISGKKANNIPICAQAEVNKNIDIEITYGEKSEEADENNKHICPKCGATLIVREVKRGKNKGNSFYGCSNFPQCRYIQNLNN
ncbi:MAG: topoisomerase DNA-binding C4 zinc finger domain-containing protein, partial [Clostridiales bacterium]|nr:topoisomerase DNA-binding C4 zinc finger domain-containing protein [Clostridiales bacterium]